MEWIEMVVGIEFSMEVRKKTMTTCHLDCQ